MVSHGACHPARYVVSRAFHPVRYLISPAAYPDRYVVATEVFLILMWSHLERRRDRYAVAPGASSRSLSDLTCRVILTVTRSHPARHPKRCMLGSHSQAKNRFRGSHLARHRDRYLISHAASSYVLLGLTRVYPDRHVFSPGASHRPVDGLSC